MTTDTHVTDADIEALARSVGLLTDESHLLTNTTAFKRIGGGDAPAP